MITFTEEGTSVPIATPHVVSIMDEEGHNISRLRVELVSPNGILDPSDAIFLRSPVALQFKDDFRTEPTTRVIDITINATTAVYTEALLSIFYDNAEKEPTLFNETNSPLLREVLVTIFDNNFLSEGQVSDPESNFDDNLGVSQTTVHVGITISPINDNAPRILIRAEPDGCGIGSAEDEMPTLARRRRDVKAASSRIRKRSIINHRDDRSKVNRTVNRGVFISRGRNSVLYRGVLISGCWNRGVPLYTEVSSFQGVGIEEFHCIQRCPHFRVLE